MSVIPDMSRACSTCQNWLAASPAPDEGFSVIPPARSLSNGSTGCHDPVRVDRLPLAIFHLTCPVSSFAAVALWARGRFKFWYCGSTFCILPRGASGISAPRDHHLQDKEHHPRLIRRLRRLGPVSSSFLVPGSRSPVARSFGLSIAPSRTTNNKA